VAPSLSHLATNGVGASAATPSKLTLDSLTITMKLDILDVLSSPNEWYVGIVIRLDPARGARVHFEGFSESYDTWIKPRDFDWRLRPASGTARTGQLVPDPVNYEGSPAMGASPRDTKSPRKVLETPSRNENEPVEDAVRFARGIPPFDAVGRLSTVRDGQIDLGVQPPSTVPDTRICRLCYVPSDLDEEQEGRLIFDPITKNWNHVNCLLWSAEVNEIEGGTLDACNSAQSRGRNLKCTRCGKYGGTIGCERKCTNSYHFKCALLEDGLFTKDKKFYCKLHKTTAPTNSQIPSFKVARRVLTNVSVLDSVPNGMYMRIGALSVDNVGEIEYERAAFHTESLVFPVNYRATRVFWSPANVLTRALYTMEIIDGGDRPLFRITVSQPKLVFQADSVAAVFTQVLARIREQREKYSLVRPVFAKNFAETFFGLNYPTVVKLIEGLPHMAWCKDYVFQYRKDLEKTRKETLVRENPKGCARSEEVVRRRNGFEGNFAFLTSGQVGTVARVGDDENESSQVTQFSATASGRVKRLPLAMQYRELQNKKEAYRVGNSSIHSKGLFAVKPFQTEEMVIEYIGEVVGQKVADKREKIYEHKGIGTYMFRLDYDRIIDATFAGNEARFINHSCSVGLSLSPPLLLLLQRIGLG